MHISLARQVLRRLFDHQLFVKGEKCEFHKASKGEVQMDPAKVKVVTYCQFQSVEERFRGFWVLLNFIENLFATSVLLLHCTCYML